MTLHELIANGIVKDSDKIEIAKPLEGNAADIRRGNWYNDKVLDFMNAEIKSYSWSETHGFSILLK